MNNRQVEVKVEVEKASKATQISARIQPPPGDPSRSDAGWPDAPSSLASGQRNTPSASPSPRPLWALASATSGREMDLIFFGA